MIYRFYAIPIKILTSYVMDFNKLSLKFIQRTQRPRIANTILKEENKVGGLMLPNFRTVWYWQKIRLIKINGRE